MSRELTQFKTGQHASLVTEFKKGEPSANKGGYKLSEATKKRISEGHSGEKAYQWKGDNVGYTTLHKWVKKVMGKATRCEKCQSLTAKRYVWANKTGEYKRDISDWIQLCNSCNLNDNIPIHERFSKVKVGVNN